MGASLDGEAADLPLRHGLSLLADAAATRFELAATELAEQKLQIARQGACLALACFCAALGCALAVALAVFAAPAEQRVSVLGIATLGAFAAAAALVWRLQVLERRRPPLLQATLSVLRADAAALHLHRAADPGSTP